MGWSQTTARPALGPRPVVARSLDWARVAIWVAALGVCIGFWVGLALVVATLL